jgi:hypothetical protein
MNDQRKIVRWPEAPWLAFSLALVRAANAKIMLVPSRTNQAGHLIFFSATVLESTVLDLKRR